MFIRIKPNKDTYITNRVIAGTSRVVANVGDANTLDLFKLYGQTFSGTVPNVELSRILIDFDMTNLRNLVSTGIIDPSNSTFKCHLKLNDVYGGQTTPTNYTVSVFPLSASFDEGLGRDVVKYSDVDTSNWLTSSFVGGIWNVSGCGLGGGITSVCDYITASSIQSFEVTQSFITGEEDLNVDVTKIVSATLTNQIPEHGFRVSFSQSIEGDNRSYFVKRFAARTAYDQSKRPSLFVTYDDSIQDDSMNLVLDERCTMFMYNGSRGVLQNVLSGTTFLSGSNCVALNLATEVSGGWVRFGFTGSQHGTMVGVYSASVLLSSSNSVLRTKLSQSGSVNFVPMWGSLDGSVAFLTGSTITAYARSSTNIHPQTSRFTVSVLNIPEDVRIDQIVTVRVHIFDKSSPTMRLVKLPVISPGEVVRDLHYSIRNFDTNKVIVPFDTITNSTRVSSDSRGMWFKFNSGDLEPHQRYVIDIMTVTNGVSTLYANASTLFRVRGT